MNRSPLFVDSPPQPLLPRESATSSQPSRARRWLIKLFVVTLLLIIIIQCLPQKHAWIDRAKDVVGPLARGLGISQREWSLFAPDPKLNNAWFSAELCAPDGTLTTWNSTYWGTASGAQKFRDFRSLNFGNRLSRRDPLAREDFADYIARKMLGPETRAVVLPAEATRAVSESTDQARLYSFPSNLPESDLLESDSLESDSLESDLVNSKAAEADALPRWRLVLYRSQLQMTLPADGTFPSRDETVWIASSQQLALREYLP